MACHDVKRLRNGASWAAIACVLAACVAPAVPDTPPQPQRGAGSYTLYLPRISRSPLPARLYLPRIARQSAPTLFLPAIMKSYPACVSLGGDCGEPNGTLGTAFRLNDFNRPYYGTVFTATADAYDYFSASLSLGKRYTVTLSGGGARGSPFAGLGDADLYLYDAAGVLLAKSDNYGQGAETIVYTPAVLGQYFLLSYGFHTPVAAVIYRLEVRDAP